MARPIDADALLELLKNPERYGYLDIIDILNAPTIEAEPKWISVKDRLPEFGEKIYCRRNTDTVLAWDGYEYVMGYFAHHSQFDEVEFNGVDEDGNYMVRTPTHWMPLPEPPEGVRK